MSPPNYITDNLLSRHMAGNERSVRERDKAYESSARTSENRDHSSEFCSQAPTKPRARNYWKFV
jgi:hypothetical protein